MAMNEDVPGLAEDEGYVTWNGGIEDDIRGAHSGTSEASYSASEAEAAEREEEARHVAAVERARREQALREAALLRAQEMAEGIRGLIERHVKFIGSHESGILTLWALSTWVHEYQESTPYILITSPAAESGKSTAMKVLSLVTRKPKFEADLTAANLLKYAHEGRTLFIDEADELGKDKSFRGIINSGYKPGTTVTRRGEDMNTYSPKCIAGIARDTLPVSGATLSRCINIGLQRALPGEVEKLRVNHPATRALVTRITEWVKDWALANAEAIAEAAPHIPEGWGNRPAELWEPLFAVADLLGGTWAADSRRWAAGVENSKEVPADPNAQLVTDIKAALAGWKQTAVGTRIKVDDLHKLWLGMPERSHSEALDKNRFSRRLAAFGLKSTPDKGSRWYRVLDAQGGFAPEWEDTFARYAIEQALPGDDAE